MKKKAGVHKIARSEGATNTCAAHHIADRCAADCHQKAAHALGHSTHHGWRCFVVLGLVEL